MGLTRTQPTSECFAELLSIQFIVNSIVSGTKIDGEIELLKGRAS